MYNTCRSITIVSYQFCFEASLVCRRYVRVHYPVFDLPLNGTVLVILTKRVLCLFIVRSGVWSLACFCFFLAVLEKSKAICICNFKCTLEINKWHLAVMKLLLSPTCFRQFLFFSKFYFIESLWPITLIPIINHQHFFIWLVICSSSLKSSSLELNFVYKIFQSIVTLRIYFCVTSLVLVHFAFLFCLFQTTFHILCFSKVMFVLRIREKFTHHCLIEVKWFWVKATRICSMWKKSFLSNPALILLNFLCLYKWVHGGVNVDAMTSTYVVSLYDACNLIRNPVQK